MVEVAPHQFVDPRADALLRLRLGGGQREPRPHTLAHRDRAEAQIRGEPGGAGDCREVTIDVIATRRTVEERLEPRSCRRRPATRDVGRIRRPEPRLAKERHQHRPAPRGCTPGAGAPGEGGPGLPGAAATTPVDRGHGRCRRHPARCVSRRLRRRHGPCRSALARHRVPGRHEPPDPGSSHTGRSPGSRSPATPCRPAREPAGNDRGRPARRRARIQRPPALRRGPRCTRAGTGGVDAPRDADRAAHRRARTPAPAPRTAGRPRRARYCRRGASRF